MKLDPSIPNTRKILGSTENREMRKYGTRNKTQELMNFAKDKEANDEVVITKLKLKIHRQNCIHRRNRYIRKPFDIDILLGYDKENSFEQLEIRFAASGRDKRKVTSENDKKAKSRRKESKKIWISELQPQSKANREIRIRILCVQLHCRMKKFQIMARILNSLIEATGEKPFDCVDEKPSKENYRRISTKVYQQKQRTNSEIMDVRSFNSTNYLFYNEVFNEVKLITRYLSDNAASSVLSSLYAITVGWITFSYKRKPCSFYNKNHWDDECRIYPNREAAERAFEKNAKIYMLSLQETTQTQHYTDSEIINQQLPESK
ncbi:Corepressor interacting with rbpj 1 [Dirofilaria immitis]|nr:Corepressor interacting with rbpj 1 [Dirofilaria immitis]